MATEKSRQSDAQGMTWGLLQALYDPPLRNSSDKIRLQPAIISKLGSGKREQLGVYWPRISRPFCFDSNFAPLDPGDNCLPPVQVGSQNENIK